MKDLFEWILQLGPTYLKDLLGLIQQPKRFAVGRATTHPLPIRDALAFLTISFLLSWIIKVSVGLSSPLQLPIEVLKDGVFVLGEVLAYGAAICLAWRAVQGRAELETFFVVIFYYSGIFLMLRTAWFLFVTGIWRAFDPTLHAEMLKAACTGAMQPFLQEKAGQIFQSPAIAPLLFAILAGMAALAAWVFAGWGAYREVNRLSRPRSAMAAMIFIVLCFPITAALFYIASAAVAC
jgi:hypothetical protein